MRSDVGRGMTQKLMQKFYVYSKSHRMGSSIVKNEILLKAILRV
jgi:hypothetical protein